MKTMNVRTALAVMALSILTLCSLLCAQETVAAGGEQQELEGKWEGVEVGHETDGKCTMTVSGSSIHFQGANKNEWYKATFALPPGTDPKQLRATIKECPSPDLVGKTSLAIYKIRDGALTLTGYKPGTSGAPKGFIGDADSRTFAFKKVGVQKDTLNPSKSN